MLAAMGHNYHPAMHIAGPHMIVPAGKFVDPTIYAHTSDTTTTTRKRKENTCQEVKLSSFSKLL